MTFVPPIHMSTIVNTSAPNMVEQHLLLKQEDLEERTEVMQVVRTLCINLLILRLHGSSWENMFLFILTSLNQPQP
jgi:hypothetical protein